MKHAIYSRRVLTGTGMREAAILIQDDKVAALVPRANVPDEFPLVDYGDKVIFPGLVDAHVHINEPGRTSWEGFATATQAAAAGGVTTVADMPLNSLPVTTTLSALQQKADAAAGKLHVNAALYAGLIPGNHEAIPALLDAGVPGVKAFMVHSGIDEFPNATETDLRRVLPLLAKRNIPLLVHAELAPDHFVTAALDKEPTSYTAYLASRPADWELMAIGMLIRLCREFQTPIHIVHLSAAEALPVLAQARAEGLPITVETAPHYLYFAADTIPDGDTRYKCAPPIRSEANRQALWGGLLSGTIDFIASDHSPAPPEIKEIDSGNLQKAWGGIAGLQFSLPAVWTAAQRFGATLEQVGCWLSMRPAAFLGFGNQKGKIVPGYDADLVVWDSEKWFTVEKVWHRHSVTPYADQKFQGLVHATYIAGRKVYDNGSMIAETPGQLLWRK